MTSKNSEYEVFASGVVFSTFHVRLKYLAKNSSKQNCKLSLFSDEGCQMGTGCYIWIALFSNLRRFLLHAGNWPSRASTDSGRYPDVAQRGQEAKEDARDQALNQIGHNIFYKKCGMNTFVKLLVDLLK